MSDRALLVTRSSDLYAVIQSMLMDSVDGKALCDSVLPQCKTTASALDRITGKPPVSLMLLDATAPSTADAVDGESGRPSLDLLTELRKRRSDIRALILLPHRMEEIEAHCARSEFDYAIYCSDFTLESLRIALARVRFGGASASADVADQTPADVAVEIEIGDRLSKLTVIEDSGQPRSREVPVPYWNTLSVYADSFRNWRMFETIDEGGQRRNRPVRDWREHLKLAGMPLYDHLVRGVLGEGLLQEYEQRPEGLLRLHLRFHVPDRFFNVPFEVVYDSVTNCFVRIHVPMARQVLATGRIRPINDDQNSQLAGDLRILFIKAPVDGLLQLVDQQGSTVVANHWFESVANLHVEEHHFQDHIQGKPRKKGGRVLVDFFDGGPGHATFAENLQMTFEKNRYDIVHFAGHSFTTDAGGTFLVVPSGQDDRLSGISVSAFARWAGGAGVRFVYLSSCRGGSCRTVKSLVENGVPHVLGFRWDVEDDMAAKFAELFYKKLLDCEQPIAKAYRDACVTLHDDPDRGASPIWVSPLLAMESDDWWRRSA